MKTLLIIQGILLLSYLIIVRIKYGMTSSISATVHVLPGVQKSLYSFFMIVVALPFILILSSGWGFLSGALLWIDAAAVSVSKKENPLQSFLHNFGAMGGIGVGMIYLALIGYFWLVLSYLLFMIFLYTNKIENKTYWNECGALATAYMIMWQIVL